MPRSTPTVMTKHGGPTRAKAAERDNNFNFLRLVLASAVILGHAYEMAWNNRSHEPFAVFTHTAMSLGEVAVDGFFILSGYLILKSWMHGPSLRLYLPKRILRIVPGYLVAALLSTVIVGCVTTHSVSFLRHLDWHYPATIFVLDSPATPPVFAGTTDWSYVNGSLWTIKYEFRCYLLVALAGILGMFRRRWLWLVLFLFGAALANFNVVAQYFAWKHWFLPLGNPVSVFRLTPIFIFGGCYFLFERYIPKRPWLCVLVGCLLVPLLFNPRTVEDAVVILGAYLLFYFAFADIPALNFFKKSADISYGIYLYGWPIEAMWTWYLHTPPLVTFLASLAICVPIAWLSWHFVERPALAHKPKTSVPLPDSPAVQRAIG